MGSDFFKVLEKGESAQAAFDVATNQARNDVGWGYTGTIADKHSFIVVHLTDEDRQRALRCLEQDRDAKAQEVAKVRVGTWIRNYLQREYDTLAERCVPGSYAYEAAVADCHVRHIIDETNLVDDKWGPAGCIEIVDPGDPDNHLKDYLFFGWASS